MGFDGFPKDAAAFLGALAEHNERDWFLANKERFQASVEAPARDFLDAMVPLLSQLSGQPMAGKIFRIHRDVRFSHDKTPYNTHVRMLFHCADTDSGCGDRPVFCFSLEPDRVITGAGTGTMEFAREKLERYRAAIADPRKGAALGQLLEGFAKAKGFRVDPPALKRPPAGYAAPPGREDLLRHKAVMVWHDEPIPSALHTKACTAHLMKRFEKMYPVFDWIESL
ncbi:MAG: TIGR02453 family protein [Candidatus Hydrogenedens sp.]|nr:TIGR02453 family protein [Candidatus Hydrogenedens sp.]